MSNKAFMAGAGVSSDASLLDRYCAMVWMRAFESACAEGVKTGEIRGELHLAIGQESVAAGLMGVLRADDWLVGTHRSHPAGLAKGLDPYRMMAEIYERSTGICGGKGGHMHLFSKEHRFSTTGIVGSSLPVALGHAYASSLEGADYVAVGMTGDGGTNAGQFFETLNMAAIWNLPLVVIVENNGYGISVPAEDVLAPPGIVARAESFGISASRVDGTDVDAVAATMTTAFDGVRSGAGPTLVEVICQRFNGHYEGDPDHYRSQELRERMRVADPIAAARRVLTERDGVGLSDLDERDEAIHTAIASVLERVRSDPPPAPALAARGVFSGEA